MLRVASLASCSASRAQTIASFRRLHLHAANTQSPFRKLNTHPILPDGTDGTVPFRALTLPASDYFEPAVFERERREVWAREWLYVCRESDLESPGAYSSLDAANYSLFVIRSRDGKLNGFHNVCRHRAGPLVTEPKGRCDILRCKYAFQI